MNKIKYNQDYNLKIKKIANFVKNDKAAWLGKDATPERVLFINDNFLFYTTITLSPKSIGADNLIFIFQNSYNKIKNIINLLNNIKLKIYLKKIVLQSKQKNHVKYVFEIDSFYNRNKLPRLSKINRPNRVSDNVKINSLSYLLSNYFISHYQAKNKINISFDHFIIQNGDLSKIYNIFLDFRKNIDKWLSRKKKVVSFFNKVDTLHSAILRHIDIKNNFINNENTHLTSEELKNAFAMLKEIENNIKRDISFDNNITITDLGIDYTLDCYFEITPRNIKNSIKKFRGKIQPQTLIFLSKIANNINIDKDFYSAQNIEAELLRIRDGIYEPLVLHTSHRMNIPFEDNDNYMDFFFKKLRKTTRNFAKSALKIEIIAFLNNLLALYDIDKQSKTNEVEL